MSVNEAVPAMIDVPFAPGGAVEWRNALAFDASDTGIAPRRLPDWTRPQIPDLFVVGYGMDFNEAYRQLPWIGVLDLAADVGKDS